jgi:hypothetical protein
MKADKTIAANHVLFIAQILTKRVSRRNGSAIDRG